MKIIYSIFILPFFLLSCNSKSRFEIVDYFVDSSERGKFVFLFVETDTIIASNIMNWSAEFKYKDSLMSVVHDSVLKVLIANFFTKNSITELSESEVENLRDKYHNNPDIVEKLFVAQNGAIYTGFSRYVEGLPFPRDTVLLTSVYIPKPNYKAIDIMKPNIRSDD